MRTERDEPRHATGTKRTEEALHTARVATSCQLLKLVKHRLILNFKYVGDDHALKPTAGRPKEVLAHVLHCCTPASQELRAALVQLRQHHTTARLFLKVHAEKPNTCTRTDT